MSTKSFVLGPNADNENYVELVQCKTERDKIPCWEEINDCTKNDTCMNIVRVFDYASDDIYN